MSWLFEWCLVGVVGCDVLLFDSGNLWWDNDFVDLMLEYMIMLMFVVICFVVMFYVGSWVFCQVVYCLLCVMWYLCMLQGLVFEVFSCFELVICVVCLVKCGEVLFCEGDVFDNLYVVCLGLLKIVVMCYDGCEQVMGLYFVGEVFGFDGICDDMYLCIVVVLEDSLVCVILYSVFKMLCLEVGLMQLCMYKLMSEQIVCEML